MKARCLSLLLVLLCGCTLLGYRIEPIRPGLTIRSLADSNQVVSVSSATIAQAIGTFCSTLGYPQVGAVAGVVATLGLTLAGLIYRRRRKAQDDW